MELDRHRLLHIYDELKSVNYIAYTANLYLPAQIRDQAMVVDLFCHQISTIPSRVSEPTLAEIRLQWWRDAVLVSVQPGSDPLAKAIWQIGQQSTLLNQSLEEFLDVQSLRLTDNGFTNEKTLRKYLRQTGDFALRYKAHVYRSMNPRPPNLAFAEEKWSALAELKSYAALLVAAQNQPIHLPVAQDITAQTQYLVQKQGQQVNPAWLSEVFKPVKHQLNSIAPILKALPRSLRPIMAETLIKLSAFENWHRRGFHIPSDLQLPGPLSVHLQILKYRQFGVINL